MAAQPVGRPWSVRISQPVFDRLHAHLFPGDGDEHGAVLAAGICETERGTRLLVRELFLARDGVDYVPGQRGYRMLTARFVAEIAGQCAADQLCYLAVHNHGGRGAVAFSGDDLASHERGYPALLDLTNGGPVGALVFAEDAAAGDIWLASGTRQTIEHVAIVGPNLRLLFPEPVKGAPATDPVYDRHVRMFGDLGQQRLKELKVGVIGAGGGGSLLVQMLSRLGVGHIVTIDPQRVEPSNIPRIVGATRRDAGLFPLLERIPVGQRLGSRFARHKVHVAERVARQAQPGIRFDAIVGDVVDTETADLLRDADVLFLATDNMESRLVFNALVHQYLIPGFQIGAKVRPNLRTRLVEEISAVSRPVLPYAGGGCLLCNRLIPPGRLQQETLSEEERLAQRYVDDDEVAEPSVITLNTIGAGHAANDMLLIVTALFADETDLRHLLFDGRTRSMLVANPTTNPGCLHCGSGTKSQIARGDWGTLPCRVRHRA
jgi:molybdopterin/thiamine biosynthesis adenylyltransferase